MKMWLKIAALLLLGAVFHAGDRCDGRTPERIPARIMAATLSAHDTEAPSLADTPLAATVSTTPGSRLSSSEVSVTKPRPTGSETFSLERYGRHQATFTSGLRHSGTRPIPNYTRAADRYIYGLRKIII